MVLNKIEIQGFKSFPDRIKVSFGSGITAVVGPNGSGKSNISDAVRWVMGETSAKQLRGGSKMEAVIFDGAKNRGAMGYASVSLTLDNSEGRLDIDAPEITIGRKVYRSGNSEYTINGKQVRLKDIYELLLDTGLGRDGYSMIGQGRIAEIVSARSGERREIFEEASGIAKYRYRRNEAEKKLAATAENMIRLTDIFSELEARVGPLARESEKAKRFLVLADERKRCEITLYLDILEKTKVLLREAANKREIVSADYDENRSTIDRIEKKIEQLRRQAGDALIEIEQKNAEIRLADEQSASHANRIAVLKNDNVHIAGRAEALQAELSGLSTQGESEKQQIEEQKQLLEKLTEEFSVAETAVASLVAEIDELARQAAETGRERDSAEYRQASLSSVLADLRITEATISADIESVSMAQTEAEQAVEESEQRLEAAKAECKKYRRRREDIAETISRHTNINEGLRLKLEAKRRQTESAKAQQEEFAHNLRKMTDRLHLLEDLQNNNDGYFNSVKAVLTAGQNGRLGGILGAVSSLISVKKGYEVAIETALGNAAQNIIVENERSAKSAISMLKEDRLGRATFLPLDTVRPSGEIRDRIPDGAITAESLITADKKYDKVVSNLLGRILVAEDINTASNYAKQLSYRYRIVTTDGQVINAGGSFTGGSLAKGSGAFSRKTEIETLKNELKKQSLKKEELAEVHQNHLRELAAVEADMTAADAERRSADEDLIRLSTEEQSAIQLRELAQSSVDTALTRQEAVSDRLVELNDRKAQTADEMIKLKGELEQLIEQIKLHSDEQHSDNIQQKQQELSQGRLTALALQKDVEQARSSYESLCSRAGQAAEELMRREEQLKELEKTIESNRIECEQAIAAREKSIAHAKELSEDIEKIRKNRLTGEGEITRLSGEVKQYYSRQEDLTRERTTLIEKEHSHQSEYDSTITKLWEDYELGITDAAEFVIEYESLTALKKRVSELRSEIRGLGNVNVAAIEEYGEVSERYEFMKRQLEDIEQARAGLTRLINELSQDMKNIFAESFERINRHFGDIFTRLFGGGSAGLSLSDPENILESGIDIAVSPPGKVIKNLESLSGGEQALVAIAIYFAILAVNPAPFCVLDEIDAALDDVNVVRFASYLKNITDTQFIVITHRRGTMEEANVLYGVTMQEDGVSKLLRLDTATNDIEMMVNE